MVVLADRQAVDGALRRPLPVAAEVGGARARRGHHPPQRPRRPQPARLPRLRATASPTGARRAAAATSGRARSERDFEAPEDTLAQGLGTADAAAARTPARLVRLRPLRLPRPAAARLVARRGRARLGRDPGRDPGSDLGAQLPGRERDRDSVRRRERTGRRPRAPGSPRGGRAPGGARAAATASSSRASSSSGSTRSCSSAATAPACTQPSSTGPSAGSPSGVAGGSAAPRRVWRNIG